jgi:hypothetical protein
MFRIVIVLSVALAAALVGIIILSFYRPLAPQNVAPQTHAMGSQSQSPVINPSVFADGMGIYSREDNKYSMLVWKKRLINNRGTVDEKDIQEALQQAVPVKRSVKFFAYGLDISSWPVVPPYSMAFCYAPDASAIAGIFPMRIMPMGSQIYELMPPPIIEDLAAGTTKHLFWGINFQYSCNEAWVFKFVRP